MLNLLLVDAMLSLEKGLYQDFHMKCNYISSQLVPKAFNTVGP